MVVLHHFEAYNHVRDSSLVLNGHLYVDFFFVLSGFVICATYRDRLNDARSLWRFMIRRFGRLWPLHAFILLAFIGLEFAYALFIDGGDLAGRAAFTEKNNVPAIFTNLFLIHSLGVHVTTTWNDPSWSISTEFYTYLLFGACVLLLQRRVWIAAVAGLIGGVWIIMTLAGGQMTVTADYGLARCVAGFGAGVLTFYLYEKVAKDGVMQRLSAVSANGLEIVTVAAVLTFIALSPGVGLDVAAPVVFAAVILVFAFERGWLSRRLLFRPFVKVGELSYSIYMTHFLIQFVIINVFEKSESILGMTLTTEGLYQGREAKMLGRTLWEGDLITLGMLLIVLVVSLGTYHLVEVPARNWFRNTDRWGGAGGRSRRAADAKLATPGQ